MVFFILLLPVLFGFMGFGVDFGLLYVSKGKLQDVADAAALAGAAHIGEEDIDFEDGIDPVGKAVRAFVKGNGLELADDELMKVEQAEGAWEALGELEDDKNLRVAYGIVTVDSRDRVRVRIDKRVPIFFLKTLVSDWGRGVDVRAVAAAEGVTGSIPDFRIIGRNGVYDNFFRLSLKDSDEKPEKPSHWLDGSVYAGNMLRVSYKKKNPGDGRNMFSVNGYIFADMYNTGIPLLAGMTGTEKKPNGDRVFRNEYIRRKNGDEVLSGLNALTKTSFTLPGWNGTAQELAENKLIAYKQYLQGVIDAGTKKNNARMQIGKNRYVCNRAVFNKLTEADAVNLRSDRDIGFTNRPDKKTNHQYSNIEPTDTDIDTLYVEIQGDWKKQDLALGREGAVWIGVHNRGNTLDSIKEIIVELHCEPDEKQSQEGLKKEDLTGSCIINLGRGCTIGSIYSQANLIIRAPYANTANSQGLKYYDFTGPIYCDKTLSFSYDDVIGGSGTAAHHFGKDTVLYADLILFGYGYEIGGSMLNESEKAINRIHTHHYDELTNFRTTIENTTPSTEEWWIKGIKTVDLFAKEEVDQWYSMKDYGFHDEEYVKKHEGAVNEINLLNSLWGAIDQNDKTFNEYHNNAIQLKGCLYGDFGHWPSEFSEGDGIDRRSSLRICPFEEREGVEMVTTKLRLVE